MGSNHAGICARILASLRGTPAGTGAVDIKARVSLEAACRQIHHVRFVLGFALLQNPPLSLGVRVCVSLHACLREFARACVCARTRLRQRVRKRREED